MVGVLGTPAPAGRGRWYTPRLLSVHLAGLLLTAIPAGALLGLAGSLAGLQPPASLLLGLTGALAVAYALHDAQLVRLPHPQRRVQVPNRWRRSRHRTLMAFGYGLGLGPGFLVYVRSGAFFVVVVAAVLSGSVLLGAVAFGAIAAGRFAFTAGARAYSARNPEPLAVAMARLDFPARLATATATAAIGAFLLVQALLR